jgi:hypothetical protein
MNRISDEIIGSMSIFPVRLFVRWALPLIKAYPTNPLKFVIVMGSASMGLKNCRPASVRKHETYRLFSVRLPVSARDPPVRLPPLLCSQAKHGTRSWRHLLQSWQTDVET